MIKEFCLDGSDRAIAVPHCVQFLISGEAIQVHLPTSGHSRVPTKSHEGPPSLLIEHDKCVVIFNGLILKPSFCSVTVQKESVRLLETSTYRSHAPFSLCNSSQGVGVM